MLLNKYMSAFQASNSEKFNKDFLNVKERDNEIIYLETVMKTLNSIEGMEYVKMEEVKHRIYDPTEEDLKATTYIDIDKSLLKIYRFFFRITKDDRCEIISFDLFYPELIKGQYFLINDNRYFPVFQMLDSSFFNTPKAVVLKTLVMPIVMTLLDDSLTLNLFKKKINPFNYYFAKFGFYETLDYFGIKDKIIIKDTDKDLTIDLAIYTKFAISKKLFFYIETAEYDKDKFIYNSIMHTLSTRSRLERLDEEDVWKKKLGSFFTTTTDKAKKIAKADNTLVSLERCLDDLNKNILRLAEEDKSDIYALLRYMIRNYGILRQRNNCEIANKRIRSHEYLVYPLLTKFSGFVRRINNGKNITFEKLCDFKPSKGFIVKFAITNELLRYDNSCNSISLVTKLRFSQGGIQSQFSSGSVNIVYRTNHPSYVGKIDLLATSAGSPGCTGLFTPFCQLYDDRYFTKDENNEIL